MRDLMLQIDLSDGRRVGLERALRDAIRDGQLPPGTRLPATRELAVECGMARATVVAAYEQLTIEGYLVAKQGAGTRVAEVPITERAEATTPSHVVAPHIADFRPGEPDAGLFPRSAWSRSVRRVLTESTNQAFGYPDPRGAFALRSTLAEYLGRSRAVLADADGVSIFGGVMSSFGFLGEALLARGVTHVAAEDPSLFLLRDVLSLVGITCVPVPIDAEGVDVNVLSSLDVGAVVVTPGHQFPLGITMSPERRAELIKWANDSGSWIIEDDYDGEFRYDRRPIGALQGLDPDRVIYAGTASKTLSPALRMSWLVVPRELRAGLARAKHLRAGVSSIEQLALADFIDGGTLDRHLRLARATYLKRQRSLTDMLGLQAPWLEVSPSRAGLHLAATINSLAISEASLVEQATRADISVVGFGPLWFGSPTIEGIVLGYSRPAEHQFPTALERLSDFLAGVQV